MVGTDKDIDVRRVVVALCCWMAHGWQPQCHAWLFGLFRLMYHCPLRALSLLRVVDTRVLLAFAVAFQTVKVSRRLLAVARPPLAVSSVPTLVPVLL